MLADLVSSQWPVHPEDLMTSHTISQFLSESQTGGTRRTGSKGKQWCYEYSKHFKAADRCMCVSPVVFDQLTHGVLGLASRHKSQLLQVSSIAAG